MCAIKNTDNIVSIPTGSIKILYFKHRTAEADVSIPTGSIKIVKLILTQYQMS